MAWELPSPWNWIVALVTVVVVSGVVFWFSFGSYHRRYFFDKALQLALWRTLGWVVLYGGSVALVVWLVSALAPIGWLRYLIGGAVWWLLSETVLAAGVRLLDRALENL